MSRYNKPKLKKIESIAAGISRVTLIYERPSNTTVKDRKAIMEESNEYIYIGRGDDWILEDGTAVATPDHLPLLREWGKLYELQIKFNKWIKKAAIDE